MTGDDSSLDAARLLRRLKRERATREQAEQISERATRTLYDRQRDLELLESVAKASNEAHTLAPALQVAIDSICAHTGWPVGHAYVRDGDGRLCPAGIWYSKAGEGFTEFKRVTAEFSFGPGEGLPGRIAETREPLWIRDVLEDENFPRAREAADLGVHAAFGFPVTVGDQVECVFEFFSPVPLAPDEPLLRSMAQIGNHLARVVERVRNQELLSYQATHDPLTGLPNRVLILEHLKQSLAELERRPGLRHAVLFIDLDGFKQVNDTIGHAAGDQVLREVADRLDALRRKSDILGRLSGDEFVLVCQDLPNEWHADTICRRVFRSFDEDFLIGDEQFRLAASVGIAFCTPGEGLTAGEAITRADAAMYRAKKQAGTTYAVYDEELERSIKRRLSLETELRRAVQRRELFLDYQPEINVASGHIVGTEALLRWRRADGVLPPAEFIPLAEETGIIVPIGGWVIEEACRQTTAWQREFGAAAPWMSVNLSVRQLADPATLAMAKATLTAYPEAAGNLFFEVTESVLLDDAESGLKVLGELKQLGTEIAIDDFGTGYASLSYLRRFPASAVKIDRSFVNDLNGNPAALAIVSSVVDLAHALGLQAVAEGVESAEQLEILSQLGCDLVQGFYLARPQPAEQINGLLAAGALIRT